MLKALTSLMIGLCGLSLTAQTPESSPRIDRLPGTIIFSSGSPLHKGTRGTLQIEPDQMQFFGDREGHFVISKQSVSNVSVERQLIEKGGRAGTLLRMGIPYGGGSALALLSPMHISLVTISYIEPSSGMHQLVLGMPENEAAQTLSGLPASIAGQNRYTGANSLTCAALGYRTVLVEPIEEDRTQMPQAYRALLYEDLVSDLSEAKETIVVMRYGRDLKIGVCPQFSVHIAVVSYTPGNQMLRAATGLLGFFLKKVQVEYVITLVNNDGETILSKPLKATLGGDKQDTGIAFQISRKITKEVERTMAQAAE